MAIPKTLSTKTRWFWLSRMRAGSTPRARSRRARARRSLMWVRVADEGSSSPWRAKGRSAWRISPAEENRAAGEEWTALATIASMAGGTPSAISSPPVRGTPAGDSIAASNTPAAKMSSRRSGGSPRRRSGGT
jgi:hypothetical protein